MLEFSRIEDLQKNLHMMRNQGNTIGFVPTMGALHPGHISLIKASKTLCDFTVCSIFVNPTQFNDKKDLERYPRTLEKDRFLLEDAQCDVLFVPEVDEMYPNNEKLPDFSFGPIESVMEGAFRPGHFKGVATIVDKLFKAVQPNKAFFGEKDFQQLAIITLMAKRLHPEIEVIPCPTFREKEGLAMSSRNVLLSPEEKITALILSKTLMEAKKNARKIPVASLTQNAISQIKNNQYVELEYFQVVNAESLQEIKEWNDAKKVRACVAARVGKVRLIDNIEL